MRREEKLSAEEKLFQMIQDGGERPQRESKSVKGKFFNKLNSVSSIFKKLSLAPHLFKTLHSELHHKFHFKKSNPSPKIDKKQLVATLNKALIASGAIIVSLSITNIFFFQPDIGLLHSQVAASTKAPQRPSLELPPVDEFLTAIARRNLFQPKTQEVEATTPTAETTTGIVKATSVLDNLKLVGIAWGANAEAMIQEVKEGRTFFLKEGETIRGVLIKKIEKDRVIVEYGGETKELI